MTKLTAQRKKELLALIESIEPDDDELTFEQIYRQDNVDIEIQQLLNGLAPVGSDLDWDIEQISIVREAVQTVLCDNLKLMTEMEFYPYIELKPEPELEQPISHQQIIGIVVNNYASDFAKYSGLSKSYISQVKTGKRPASNELSLKAYEFYWGRHEA